MKRGPFEVLKSKEIYKNPWIKVREDKVIRPGGEEGLFGIVEGASGSSVVALTKDDKVYLVKEYHYAQNETTYEVPSGGIDKDETPLESAKRELKEETGLTANKWTDLGYINPLTVVAEELEEGEILDKEKDLIEVTKISFKEALNMVLNGEITHSASVVAIPKTARLKGL